MRPNPFNRVSVTLSSECQNAVPVRTDDPTVRKRRQAVTFRVPQPDPSDRRRPHNPSHWLSSAGITDLDTDESLPPKHSNGHGLKGSSLTISDMSQIEGRNPMSAHHRHHGTTVQTSERPVTRFASDPPQHHTHLQQVA